MSEPRFLMVRYSAIGDCVMCVPVAAAFRSRFPDGFLAWAIEKRCEAVADMTHLLSERHAWDRTAQKQSSNALKAFSEQMRFYSSLRKLNFDYGLDLQGHSKTALCLRLAAPKHRYGFRATDPLARRLNRWLLTDDQQHVVEQNLEAFSKIFHGQIQSPNWVMPDFPSSQTVTDKNHICIAVGAGAQIKEYSKENWQLVANQLVSNGFQVSFIGGPTDSAPDVTGAINQVGKLSLQETMSLIQQSRLVLCADTGAGHIAAAYGVPVVSIFGPTSPSRYRPYTRLGTVLKVSDNPNDVDPTDIISSTLQLLEASE